MMIQMVDRPNTTPIGHDRKIWSFKALLYLNVAVHVQVCRLICAVYIPLFSLVQLGYPPRTNIFAGNQVIRCKGPFIFYEKGGGGLVGFGGGVAKKNRP